MLNTIGKPHATLMAPSRADISYSLFLGQCLSVLASYSFPTSQGPKFTKGITLNIAFQALGFILALAMSAYYRWENKRRDRVEGERPAPGAVLNTMEEHDLARGENLKETVVPCYLESNQPLAKQVSGTSSRLGHILMSVCARMVCWLRGM
jgi:hypothetical protein